MAEINVVPYIDVMLVLLVIFMVTAPLLYQGVEIDLPQSSAEPMPPQEQEPVIVEVDQQGRYYLSVGEQDDDQPVSAEDVVLNVTAVMRARPDTPVFVRGDGDVAYARVIDVMTALQRAGVPQVGLMTQPSGDTPANNG
ncbi:MULTISPECIES: protein TolR [Spiribacter]|jgi:biopolymer transport protein TolR|uniref:protein TolR n=1 Tax=Spiribacter TaxID=1335745 RepID=UPI000F71CDC4|nr:MULTISPECIES: protein TolR [Spiribacter]AUB77870.1 protein TolR [Spiribacter roseus]KAF0283488.1 protein TolR [Spiribacter roseus]KAF0285972.1 protein TolR [Spiribacter sp. SSL99]